MINLCPVGRSCSQEERDEFGRYDQVGVFFIANIDPRYLSGFQFHVWTF